ncbi:hypothetical protein HA402_007743 [Bradysia odoriphaga]|nr:hypothetical protein HA402_007743 [Bradysia odoriphaga]
MASDTSSFFTQYNLSQYNITQRNLQEFLEILNISKLNLSKPYTSPKYNVDPCAEYCSGSFHDAISEYKSFHGYVSLVVCIFGTIANILNIIVLTRKDMSKTPINMILKWLAVADMFVMIEYIPFSYFHYIAAGHRYAYSMATFLLFHMNFTQILHTISISLTVTLAVWRYVAIKHPHGKFATHLLSHCGEAILVSFVISPILCMPTYFVFKVNEKFNNATYTMTYLLDAEEDTWLYRFLLGRWRQALDVFVKAESLLQRADAEVYYYIGDLLCRNATHPRANINEAKEYFHRAIQNGRQIESHQKLALIYKEENNFAKAIEILEHSLQIIPENVDVLTEIGILYLKVNDTKSAFDKLFQATKLDENCTKAIMALGAILQASD